MNSYVVLLGLTRFSKRVAVVSTTWRCVDILHMVAYSKLALHAMVIMRGLRNLDCSRLVPRIVAPYVSKQRRNIIIQTWAGCEYTLSFLGCRCLIRAWTLVFVSVL